MALSLSRRRMLKLLGLTAAATVPSFRHGVLHADNGAATERTCFVTMPVWLGIQPWSFFPGLAPGEKLSKTGPDKPTEAPLPAQLPAILAPLQSYRDRMLIIGGMDHEAARQTNFGGHATKEIPSLLSGTRSIRNAGSGARSAGGITLDQHIANAIGHDTRFGSLEFSVVSRMNRSCPSWRGPFQPQPGMLNPFDAFDRVFGILREDMSLAEVERVRQQRRSILDHLTKDLTATSAMLSGDDRCKLEVHTETIRDLERRLASTDFGGPGCTLPELGARLTLEEATAVANAPAVTRMHLDIMATALICDLTRVASLHWGTPTLGPWNFSFLEHDDGTPMDATKWHSLSHYSLSAPHMLPSYRWFAEHYAYLAGRLDAVSVGGGQTLLDRSLLLWISEYANGASHTFQNLPVMMLGSAGGAFRTGRFLHYPVQPHNALLTSIANAYTEPSDTFGDPEFCGNGPLPLLS